MLTIDEAFKALRISKKNKKINEDVEAAALKIDPEQSAVTSSEVEKPIVKEPTAKEKYYTRFNRYFQYNEDKNLVKRLGLTIGEKIFDDNEARVVGVLKLRPEFEGLFPKYVVLTDSEEYPILKLKNGRIDAFATAAELKNLGAEAKTIDKTTSKISDKGVVKLPYPWNKYYDAVPNFNMARVGLTKGVDVLSSIPSRLICLVRAKNDNEAALLPKYAAYVANKETPLIAFDKKGKIDRPLTKEDLDIVKVDDVNWLSDLVDQVQCSLTDAGVNNIYKALGPLNGQGHYGVHDVTSKDKGSITQVIVSLNTKLPEDTRKEIDLNWAKHIADVYGLKYTENTNTKTLFIDVPNLEYVQVDKLVPEWQDIYKKRKEMYDNMYDRYKDSSSASFNYFSSLDSAANESLTENYESSKPVEALPYNTVYDFIEQVPVATATKPPVFFNVGYIKEEGVAKEFKDSVKIIKCSEMTVYTGANYEDLSATKEMRKETGKERDLNRRAGITFDSENSIANKIALAASGDEILICYCKRGSRIKVKYFISVNDEDLHLADKSEVAKYLTASAAKKLEAEENPANIGAITRRLKLSKIYMIGDHGRSIM